jgi:excisionase family DNA binding protein
MEEAMRTTEDAVGDRLAISVVDAARLTGLGRTSIYAAIATGALTSRKFGRRTLILLILRDDLRAWVEGLPGVNAGAVSPVDVQQNFESVR